MAKIIGEKLSESARKAVDADADNVIDEDEQEEFAYRVSNNALERFQPPEGALLPRWEPVVEGIDALNFVFKDANGNVTTDLNAIRMVEITLITRTEYPDHNLTDNTTYLNKQGVDICPSCTGSHYRRLMFSTAVRPRNLGL